MSAATSFSLPVRLAANFYRTRVIAFSSVTVNLRHERGAHPFERNFSRSLLSFLSRSDPRHSTTTHAASASRHVTRVRRTEAHNARVARTMRSDCTGRLVPAGWLHFLFSHRWLHARWCSRPARNPWIVPLCDYFFLVISHTCDTLILRCNGISRKS